MSVNKLTTLYEVLEGDCLEYLNQGAISNIHLTFVDPPFRQGKDYRFFSIRYNSQFEGIKSKGLTQPSGFGESN